MLSFATSVLHEYALIWKDDPALIQPEIPAEAEQLPGESPEVYAARKAERDQLAERLRDEHERAWVRAVETGQWDAIKRGNAQPTVFWCRPIPGPTWRAFIDYINREDIGGFQRPALAFRLAVTRIENFAAGQKVEHVEHVDKRGDRTGLGRVLSEDVVRVLDDGADASIVTVLGYAILKSRAGPHPL